MAPPAKRRKRNIVDSEDDDSDEVPQARKNSLQNFLYSSPDTKPRSSAAAPAASPSPLRKTTRAAAAAKPSNGSSKLFAAKTATKSPSTSPEKKGKASKKAKVEERGKNADLRSLFSRQQARTDGKAQGRKKEQADGLAIEDMASDPISEDDDVAEHKTAVSSLVGKTAQRRSRDTPHSTSSSFSTTSQKFLRPPKPAAPSSAADDDLRPWSERFAPVGLEELAVHKKKVADVRRWLDDVLGGRMRQRLLVLKGAAGTGKTTTVQMLARDMGCEILEWRNPAGSLGANLGYSSASAQFEEFMNRGERFGQLDTDSDGPPLKTPNGHAADEQPRKMILIEEFPNTFARSSSALTSFRSTISQFLATNTPALAAFAPQPAQDSTTPVVMIISETLLATTSASADSFTAHRLLGPEILRHPGVGLIEFNAIAPTLLAKALELVVQKEARKSGRRTTPGPQVLKRLGEIGDIRNAVASLEFLCLKGDDADWGAKVAFTKGKRGAKDVALTKGEQETLELVSQREASLGIFHAVGKVVYNKREELPYPAGSVEAEAETLPAHLARFSKPKKSLVSVDRLIDETGTDTHTFVSALHENYALSCEQSGPRDARSSLDYINDCIDMLSDCDLMCPSWDVFFGGKGFSGGFGRDVGSHIVRQDELAFQAAVRGLLFSLPSPVKRTSTGSSRGGDQFKMFYPASLKLWRTREELEGLADMWSSKMLEGGITQTAAPQQQPAQKVTNGPTSFRKSKGGSVGDWATNRAEQSYAAKKAAPKQPEKEEEEAAAPLLSLGSSARKEMLLERLPYMAHIARRKKCSFFSMGTRDLDRVVSFQGIGAPATEDSSDEGDDNAAPSGEAWATDKPSEESSPRKRRVGAIRARKEESQDGMPAGLQVQKLVLSDDDIEDD